MVRNQVYKRRHSRNTNFVAILRRLYYVSSKIHDITYVSNNFERFEVKKTVVISSVIDLRMYPVNIRTS